MISSFGFSCLDLKLVGMFFGIVPMFVLKDFVRHCCVVQIRAKMCECVCAHIFGTPSKILGYDIETIISKGTCLPQSQN